ncbi:putative membrane protein YccC [Microbacterium resistens]|uniref:Membrane protein YccC n=1 Tax=Microbacterium resistens TaxID=156977 RepID=A0ABU1S7F8_9MICO|nr:histidinol dehydrogenase [Microbacterium resistens]MDR6865550.1 putative membrane protein YccC [Microbacterium resistens]
MRESRISRVLSWVGTLIVGAVYGIATTIGHASVMGPVPVGMIVGAISCAALLVAVRTLTHDRWATLTAGLGMIAAVLVLSGRGPGGSVLVPDGLLGRVWGYLVAGIVLLVIAWPDLSRLRTSGPASATPAATSAAPADGPVAPPTSITGT